jgi:hypothetical protein
MLKEELELASDFRRQCVIGFDEMSIESSLVYCPTEDKVYGPKTQMNVWFVRGLFEGWKQVIAFNFDENLSSEKFLEIVTHLEKAGLRVRGNVNDWGGKNQSL